MSDAYDERPDEPSRSSVEEMEGPHDVGVQSELPVGSRRLLPGRVDSADPHDTTSGRGIGEPVTFFIFLYILIRPVSFNVILLSLLAAWGAWSFGRLFFLGGSPSSVVRLFVPLIGFGLAWTSYGGFIDNPGWLSGGFLVWVVAPFLYGLISAGSSLATVESMYRAITIATFLIASAIFMVWAQVGVEIVQLVDPPSSGTFGARVNGSGLSATVAFVGLQSLVAAVPICIGRGFVGARGWWRTVTLVVGLYGLAAVSISGRRGGLGAYAGCLFVLLVWAQRRKLALNLKRFGPPFAFFVGMALAAILVASPSLLSPLGRVFESAPSLLGVSVESEVERSTQAGALVNAWTSKPLHGWGFGAVYPLDVVRSSERPWTFELQYHLLLAQTGLIGFAIWATIWRKTAATWIGLAEQRAEIMLPALLGWVAIMVANASNPYLAAPGNMWALFFPAMVYAAYERSTHPVETSRSLNGAE